MSTPPRPSDPPSVPPLPYRSVNSDVDDAARKRRRAARSWEELFGGATALLVAIAMCGTAVLFLVKSVMADEEAVIWVGVGASIVIGLLGAIAGHRAWEMLWAPRYRGKPPEPQPGMAAAIQPRRPATGATKRTVFKPLATGYAAPSPSREKDVSRADRRFRRRMLFDRFGNGIFAVVAVIVLGLGAAATRPSFWRLLANLLARLH